MPIQLIARVEAAIALFFAGRYHEAAEQFEREKQARVGLDPNVVVPILFSSDDLANSAVRDIQHRRQRRGSSRSWSPVFTWSVPETRSLTWTHSQGFPRATHWYPD